jgi:hypothetical protein
MSEAEAPPFFVEGDFELLDGAAVEAFVAAGGGDGVVPCGLALTWDGNDSKNRPQQRIVTRAGLNNLVINGPLTCSDGNRHYIDSADQIGQSSRAMHRNGISTVLFNWPQAA